MMIPLATTRSLLQRTMAGMLAVALALPLPALAGRARRQNTNTGTTAGSFTLKVNSDLVLTNVVVRNKKTGEVVKGLKPEDFTILENGKPQHIASFDFESVDQAVALNEATVSGKAPATTGTTGFFDNQAVPDAAALRDHRLIVMFFDLTSMQVEDVDRSVEAARDYVNKQMQPADLVALVSLGTSLSLDQDFTADKKLLLAEIGRYNGSEGQGFAEGGDGTTNGTADNASSYTPDDTEYNDINTDRELYAIRSIAQSLERVNQRKSLLYFSGGLTRNGIENEASLRAATNAAVRANLAIYSVDSRGLQALSPVGDATTGSLRGNAAYSGTSMQNQLDSNFSSQETLATLSNDTGGKAFFDSNDFAPAFQKIQEDTAAYYVIGFRSSNPARDGRYRKLTIRLNRQDLKDVKLEYRPGYYAPADFKHSNGEDRERQLEEELKSELPATDVAVYLQALYFRMSEDRYFVPVSLIVPGSQIPFVRGGDRDKATLDVIGEVMNAEKMQVGYVRDTVKLALDQSQQVQHRNIQYSTGFTLAPGRYRLKFVVRENQTGRMGSFEADIRVPDLKKSPLKLSSVVLSSQRVPSKEKKSDNPLIRDGVQWIPNVPHVFRQDQHLYFLYEVYTPATLKQALEKVTDKKRKKVASDDAPVHVLTSIEFLKGSTKVY
ncbi:MAG: VWA domain-containing protein [Acidobacteriaceae bacterium]